MGLGGGRLACWLRSGRETRAEERRGREKPVSACAGSRRLCARAEGPRDEIRKSS